MALFSLCPNINTCCSYMFVWSNTQTTFITFFSPPHFFKDMRGKFSMSGVVCSCYDVWKLEKRYRCLCNSGTNNNITWASSGWKVDKKSVSSLISQWGEQNIIILSSFMDLCVWMWMMDIIIVDVWRLLAAFTLTLPFGSVRHVACYFDQAVLSLCILIIPKYMF